MEERLTRLAICGRVVDLSPEIRQGSEEEVKKQTEDAVKEFDIILSVN